MYFHTPFLHNDYYSVHSVPLSQYLSSILISSKVKYEIWLSPSWTRVEIEVQLHNSKRTLDVICYSKGLAIRNSSLGKPFWQCFRWKKKKKKGRCLSKLLSGRPAHGRCVLGLGSAVGVGVQGRGCSGWSALDGGEQPWLAQGVSAPPAARLRLSEMLTCTSSLRALGPRGRKRCVGWGGA